MIFRDYIRAMKAEFLKSKRTLALALAIIAPFTVVLLNFLMYLDRDQLYGPEDISAWDWYIQGNFAIWVVLMLIMYITLITALINYIEHSNNTWKKLFSLPISKFSIYFSKLTIATVLILLSHILFGILIITSGLLLSLLNKNLGLDGKIAWDALINSLIYSFIGSIAIIGFHHWVSIRWTNIIVAFGVGMVILIANFIIFPSADYAPYFPWAYSHLLLVVGEEFNKIQIILSSIGFFLLTSILGFLDLRRKEINY